MHLSLQFSKRFFSTALVCLAFFHSGIGLIASSFEALPGDPLEPFDEIGARPYRHPAKAHSRADLGSGKLSNSFGTGDETVRSAMVGTDGRILGVGRFYDGSRNKIFLARWNATGELDFDFGTNGLQVTSIGSNDELAHSLTIQSDGKIVVAARTWTGTGFDFAVLRYHGNSSATPASLDTSFGTDGIVSFSLGAGTDIARHVFIDPRDTSQNRIVVSGYSHDGTRYIFAIARLHSDGTLDTSFKTVGYTRTALSTGTNGITSAMADPENGLGGVIAVGSALSGTDWNISTARYATNGDLNTAFFTVGYRALDITANSDAGYALTAGTYGGETRFALVGSRNNGSNLDFHIVRLVTNGALDTSFVTTGAALISIGTADDIGLSVNLAQDGKLTISGEAGNATQDFGLLRVNSNGTLDTSFRTLGMFSLAILSGDEGATTLANTGSGNLIVMGKTLNAAANLDVAMVRLATDGSLAPSDLDYTWTTTGVGHVDFAAIFPLDRGRALAVQPDGRLIVGGYIYNPAVNDGEALSLIARLNIDGSLDTAFNTTGVNGEDFISPYPHSIEAIGLRTDGSFVVGGSYDTGHQWNIMRFTSDGVLDTSFSTRGHLLWSDAVETPRSTVEVISIDTQGRSLLGGYAANTTGVASWIGPIIRMATDGTVDTSFFTNGWIANPLAANDRDVNAELYVLKLQTDGKILIGGSRNNGFAVARLQSNGTLDTAFATMGVKLPGGTGVYTSIQLLSDGRFSMSGPINPGISDYYLSNTIDGAIINRFTTNGELDATFTTASVALVRNSHKQSSHKSRASYAVHDQSHIANLANGKTMLFAGSNNGTDIAARFQSNGALDTSFSTNGKQFLDSSLCKSPGDVVVQPGGRVCTVCTNDANPGHMTVLCALQ